MRVCGHCGKAPRLDDPMATVSLYADGPTVTQTMCRDCVAVLLDQSPPVVPVYPVGSNVRVKVCGLCRRALREDDTLPHHVRLAAMDIERGGAPGEDLQPGLYSACADCAERWRPFMYQRLVEANEPGLPSYASFGGTWLM